VFSEVPQDSTGGTGSLNKSIQGAKPVKRTIVVFTSLAVFMALAAFAPAAHARHSAKQERIQACVDKSAGDPCSFTRKGEEVNGMCSSSARHGKLICMASNAGNGESSGGAMTAPGTSEGSETNGPAGSSTGGEMAPSGGAAGGGMGSPSGPNGNTGGGAGGSPSAP
jgi:hypothetical protein